MACVNYPGFARFSGAALDAALEAAGYAGPTINFGFSGHNKREALIKLKENDVPTLLYTGELAQFALPLVGRPDCHHAGQWMKVIRTTSQWERYWRRPQRRQWVTHWQTWIEEKNEYRVHIVNGKSIKISQKIGGGNHAMGAIFRGGVSADVRRELRELAKQACEVLQCSLGAIDIIQDVSGGPYFVLEVNSAPKLTDERSDTLSRYVNAIIREWGQEEVEAESDDILG